MKRVVVASYLIVLSIAYALLSIIRHSHFESGGFDLGIFDQSLWQYAHFLFPYSTLKERLILGDHLALTMPLLVPLYWLRSDVRMLLGFQAVWLVASSIPIYLLARLRKFSFTVSFLIAGLYSLFPSFQFAVFFDFHPVIIGVGLLPWIAYALERKKYLYMWIAVILLLLTQENMGLSLVSLGFLYIFHTDHRKIAIQFIIIGLLSSFIAIKIVSLLSPIGFEYAPVLPQNVREIFTQFFDQQEKRQSWLYAFGWYAFLPLLSPGALIAIFVDLSQYFITGAHFARTWSPFTHHRAILSPYLVLGFINVLSWMRKRSVPVIFVVMVVVVCAALQQYFLHYPLNKLAKPNYWKYEQWMQDATTVMKDIPTQASLATQQNLVPHLTHRTMIFMAWPRLHVATELRCKKVQSVNPKDCWWLDFPETVSYLLVDTRPYQWTTQLLETNEHFQEAIFNMAKVGAIVIKRSAGFMRLYEVHPIPSSN